MSSKSSRYVGQANIVMQQSKRGYNNSSPQELDMTGLNNQGVTKRLIVLFGLDSAIIYTVFARGWSVLAGPVTFFLLARFLSPEEQGFYYTFGSILGLQIFFELGFSNVILQFTSHESAQLTLTEGRLQGNVVAKGRLASLLRLTLRWYSVAAVLFISVVLPAGLLFFSLNNSEADTVAWRLPWVSVVCITAGILIVSPFFALLEGCGFVAEVAFMRIFQSILGNACLWVALTLHWGLFAAGMVNGVGIVWGGIWLWRNQRTLLHDLLRTPKQHAPISWWQEIWPFQWRVALSWLSGYFIFQIFNPLLFAFSGAVAAGQMGMSLSIMGAVSGVAIAWVATKAAPFGQLIAQRKFRQLDHIFFPALWQSVCVAVLGCGSFWLITVYLYSTENPLAQRILPPLPLGLLAITTILNQIVFAEAIYLRAHKQEPFLFISIVTGLLTATLAYILGYYFGATGMMAGYCMVTIIISLFGGSLIFFYKRRSWHRL